MNTETGFYPWLADWQTVVEILVGGTAMVAALYLAMRSGRLRASRTDDVEESIETDAGTVGSRSNGPTVFIWVLIAFIVAWGIAYIAYNGASGLRY